MGKTRIFSDDRARLLSKIDQSGGSDVCWPFTGARTGHGYGNFFMGGKYLGAHRAAWILMIGSIPQGLEIDHVCHNEDRGCAGGATCRHRSCANWEHHLRLVTHRDNGLSGRSGPVDQCLRGHAYDELNTYIYEGHKFCRACRRVDDPERYLRELEAQRIRAVELRSQGITFEQVARVLGYANRGSARNAIMLQTRRNTSGRPGPG